MGVEEKGRSTSYEDCSKAIVNAGVVDTFADVEDLHLTSRAFERKALSG